MMVYQFLNLYKYGMFEYDAWLQNEVPYLLLHKINLIWKWSACDISSDC